jgi:protein tyrosine phosphatase (PTP) superfamily phosphohydrolase (DUF442 family)
MEGVMKKWAVGLVGLWLGAAAAALAASPAATAPPKPVLEPASLGSTENVHRFGDIWLAGQPGKDDLEIAKELPIRTVVNLRAKSEIDWDEQAAVRALGMIYLNIAFQTPEELTDEVFDAARHALTFEENAPLLLHCASANRVGTIWLAHRVLDDGVAWESALREAEIVGLKSPAFREKAKDYIARSKAGRKH